MSLLSLEVEIEKYYEHILARDVIRYLLRKVEIDLTESVSIKSNEVEHGKYLVSIQPHIGDNTLIVSLVTYYGRDKSDKTITSGRREESAIIFDVKQLSRNRVRVNCKYTARKWLVPHVMQLWEEMLVYYEMSNEKVKNPEGIKVEQIGAAKQHRKSGRPHLQGDIWAWEQVNTHNRQKSEVYKEWCERDDVKARNLQDPERQFDRITKPEWGNK